MPVMLSAVALDFGQDTDGDDINRQMQELKVVVTHAGAGPYFVLQTNRWALDEPSELHALLATVGSQVFPLFERFNREAADDD